MASAVNSPSPGRRQRYLYTFTSPSSAQQQPERVECPSTHQLVGLVTGSNCSLAVVEDGTVLGWGRVGVLLGNPEVRWPTPQPFPLLAGLRVAQIALGPSHALILTQNGTVYSMGDGRYGKLGHGNEENCNTATLVSLPGGKVIKQVAVGEQHSLLLAEDGEMLAFGLGIYGALGVDSLEDHHKPTRVVTRNHISYIAAGYNQSFAIDDAGKAYSFGSNGPWLGHNNLSKSYLWLSRASNEKRNVLATPRRIDSASGLHMKSIAVGRKHTLMLTTDGQVYAMGKNRVGCLGMGKGHRKPMSDASRIEALADVKIDFVGAGDRHSIAVSDTGVIYTFGSGRAPSGLSRTNSSHDVPRQLYGTTMSAKPLHIAVGPRHALILLPSPLLLLPDNKSGSFQVAEINESVLDPRIEEMVRSLNLGREGEKLFSEANVSFEVLQHLTKDDLQELGLPLSIRLAVYNYMQRTQEAPRRDVLKATISQNDLSFVNKLGVGAFGDVWEGRLRGTTTVAIKSVRSADKTAFLAEAQIMSNLPAHPNVVTFFGLAEGPSELFIVTEFMPDGSLDKHLIQNRDAVSVDSLIQMTKDLAAGMDHLAAHGIIHRDLAARNLLLEIKRSDVYRVKVCDFGLSRLSTDELNPQQMKTIPVRWTAIEVFMGRPYTDKCDVWSFGVTVWEIFSFGALPYEGMSTREVVDAVLLGARLSKPDGCPDEIFTQIIVPCLQENPEDRPTFREIYRKLEFLFPTQRLSISPMMSPTTSNLSDSSSGGSGSSGVSLSTSPAFVVPASMATLVADELRASSQCLNALAPYASSSGVTTRSPAEPLAEPPQPQPQPATASLGVTESASPNTKQQSRDMPPVAATPRPSAQGLSRSGLLTQFDLSSPAYYPISPRTNGSKSHSYDEAAWAEALSAAKIPSTPKGRPRTNSGSACSSYSSISAEGLRNSLPLPTRRKKKPRAPRAGVASLEALPKDECDEVEVAEEEDGRNASPLALGRRMGIADIDPYQLLRLSESVGGFYEEDVNHQQQQQCSQAAVDAKSSPSVAKRKERALNRLTWGKFNKV